MELYIELFRALISKDNINEQAAIAEKIAEFSRYIDEEVKTKYWDDNLQDIEDRCLTIYHWKDGTEMEDINEDDVLEFIKELQEMLEVTE